MQNSPASLQECIKNCWDCRHACQETLYNHCLQQGGKHMEADHVRKMVDCIEICQTSADFMTRQSDLHSAVCAACADICEACAKSCEGMADNKMNECAKMCRRCADSCRAMCDDQRKAA